MAIHSSIHQESRTGAHELSLSQVASNVVVLLGRILFVGIFLMAGPMHFSGVEISYASAAGVPFPRLAVPVSGVIAVLGGLSILLGYRARIGALLLVIFLVPVTIMMHNFWTAPTEAMAQIQVAMFLKNISMLGAALLITQFGSGPWSLDARRSN